MPEMIISPGEIARRVGELGEEISRDYRGSDLLITAVLTGAFIFTADLVRAISLPLEVDFIRVASYGDSSSPGDLELKVDLSTSIAGRDLLIVEDIVDTGRTMAWLIKHLSAGKPGSLKVCALIDKRERREKPVKIDYPGFRIDRGFLVGYGLDQAGRNRHLPGIYSLVTKGEPGRA